MKEDVFAETVQLKRDQFDLKHNENVGRIFDEIGGTLFEIYKNYFPHELSKFGKRVSVSRVTKKVNIDSEKQWR